VEQLCVDTKHSGEELLKSKDSHALRRSKKPRRIHGEKETDYLTRTPLLAD
jgi:hypothetical protein